LRNEAKQGEAILKKFWSKVSGRVQPN